LAIVKITIDEKTSVWRHHHLRSINQEDLKELIEIICL